ncbi:hypothetical protein C7445_103100 [Alicyclobacillus sacchari]|uniref:Uncharacterized protein n=1 Tax=Alicyclobacillus sacchari TaxID=392010 RepID=A0A4R8LTX8_9BACL|nr:hypothetical protein [Alicyclobacillus sacchari]TDY50056.1 hypothetical protein C7445_103100 [Alicyclobacillus sacchari]
MWRNESGNREASFVRAESGFTLVWSVVLVVILATVVSGAIAWTDYALHTGGRTLVTETAAQYQADNQVESSFNQMESIIQNMLQPQKFISPAAANLAVQTGVIAGLKVQGYPSVFLGSYIDGQGMLHEMVRTTLSGSSLILDIQLQQQSQKGPGGLFYTYSSVSAV